MYTHDDDLGWIRCWHLCTQVIVDKALCWRLNILRTWPWACVDDWHIHTCKGRRQCRHVRTLSFGGHARKTQTFVVNVHRHTGYCRCTHMMMTWVGSDADIYAHRLLSTRHCVDDWTFTHVTMGLCWRLTYTHMQGSKAMQACTYNRLWWTCTQDTDFCCKCA